VPPVPPAAAAADTDAAGAIVRAVPGPDDDPHPVERVDDGQQDPAERRCGTAGAVLSWILVGVGLFLVLGAIAMSVMST
jgi:hypothetical protein